jgi:hypothetical protein
MIRDFREAFCNRKSSASNTFQATVRLVTLRPQWVVVTTVVVKATVIIRR